MQVDERAICCRYDKNRCTCNTRGNALIPSECDSPVTTQPSRVCGSNVEPLALFSASFLDAPTHTRSSLQQ